MQIKIFKLSAISYNQNIRDVLQILYQQNIKLLLFATINIWLDIVFAVL